MGGTRPFSSGEPYLALTFGRDLGSRASVFASLGLGAARSSCYQLSPTGDSCLGADSFGATFLEVGVSYGFAIAPRTMLAAKVLGGFTDLSPGAVQRNGSVPDHVPGLHAGGGFSLDYDTRLDHFAVGFDAVIRETFARYGVRMPSLVVMPRIRYVFSRRPLLRLSPHRLDHLLEVLAIIVGTVARLSALRQPLPSVDGQPV